MLKRITKVAVTILMLWLLARQLDWDELLRNLGDFAWWAFVVAVVLQVLTFAIGAWRWHAFFRHEGLPYTLTQLLRPYFVGALFNNLLPAATGGDVVRIYYILREGLGAAVAASPVITERIIGFTVLFGIATAALPFIAIEAKWLAHLSTLVPIVFLGLVACLTLFGWPVAYRFLHGLFDRWKGHWIIDALFEIAEASHRYLGDVPLVLRVVVLSITMQFVEVLVFWVLAEGTGSDVQLVTFAVVVPLTFVVAGLPISIGGLGVREAAAVTLFVAVGMDKSDAAAVALLFVPVLILASVPGFYFFLKTKDHQALLRESQQDQKFA